MRNWYRLMGAKIGRGTEISATFGGRYPLIELGENNFVGDEAVFGDEDVHRGWMTLARLKTGDRCFFGNSAVISQGAVIEDDALIGVKSRLPESLQVGAGETWFGSPAISLPTRQKVMLSANWTYQPSPPKRLWRMLFEAMHTSFPTAVLITMAYIAADIISEPFGEGQWGKALAIFMLAGIVTSVLMYSLALLAKWAFMGVYKPVMKPMWSWWAMRTEAVAVFYGGLASKVLLEYLRGTPFLPWLLGLFGSKIGKGTWINMSDLTEFDCVTIGDHAALNMISCPQTHLYEDRIMKVGRIEIGRGATIGTGSTILYDSKIGEFAQIRPLTMVMKGESIPAHSIWEGAPAQPVRGHATACDGSQDVTGPSGDVAEPKGPSWPALRALPRT
jgi:non-ribosomal peptide synthetase-like protein